MILTPAGTLQGAPQKVRLVMPPRVVVAVGIRVPPGPRGMLGFQIANAGVAVIPIEPTQWIVTDDDKITLQLTDYITSGTWWVISYNVGTFAHAIRITFQLDLTGTTKPPATPVVTLGTGTTAVGSTGAPFTLASPPPPATPTPPAGTLPTTTTTPPVGTPPPATPPVPSTTPATSAPASPPPVTPGPAPTFFPTPTATTVPYGTLQFHGTGYSVTAGGKLSTGTVRTNDGSLWRTIATYTQTGAAINAGTSVGYMHVLGIMTRLSTVQAFKSLERTKTGPQTTTYELVKMAGT